MIKRKNKEKIDILSYDKILAIRKGLLNSLSELFFLVCPFKPTDIKDILKSEIDEYNSIISNLKKEKAQKDKLLNQLQELNSGNDILSEKFSDLDVSFASINDEKESILPENYEKNLDMENKFLNQVNNIIHLLDTINIYKKQSKEESINNILDVVYKELIDLLNKSDISIIDNVEYFNDSEHKVLERINTEENNRHNMIKEIIRPGFRMNDRMLRQAEVNIYCCGEAKE